MPAGRLDHEEAMSYRKTGFIVIPGLLTSGEVDHFVAVRGRATPRRTCETGQSQAGCGMEGALPTHPNVVGVARQILGILADDRPDDVHGEIAW